MLEQARAVELGGEGEAQVLGAVRARHGRDARREGGGRRRLHGEGKGREGVLVVDEAGLLGRGADAVGARAADLLLAGQLAQVAREPASLIGDLCVQRGVNIAEVAVVAFDALTVRLELRPEYLLDLGTLPGKLPDVLLQDCVLICVLRGEFAV